MFIGLFIISELYLFYAQRYQGLWANVSQTIVLLLGTLGYLKAIRKTEWDRRANYILFCLFLAAAVLSQKVQRDQWAEAQKRQDFFKIIESKNIGDRHCNLRGLGWDGSNFWLTGQIAGEAGIFRVDSSLDIGRMSRIDSGSFSAIVHAGNMFAIKETADRSYVVTEYDIGGIKVQTFPLPMKVGGSPNAIAFDGHNFWIGVDEVDEIHELSPEFREIRSYPLPHRILGGTYHGGYLWLTDAYTIYKYDQHLALVDVFPFKGVTCRGIVFAGESMRSLDDGPKRIYRLQTD